MPTHYRTATESIEIAARRHFFAAAPAEFGCDILNLPGTEATLLSALAMPSPIMNRVIGLPGDAPLDAATLAQIRHAFRARGIPQFWFHAWDGPDDVALRDSLHAHGCAPCGAWIKFACELDAALPDAPPPSSLRVRRARDDECGIAGQIMCDSFGMPPLLVPWMAALAGRPAWQVYVACDAHDVPVATGTLFIDGAHAWLGMAATLPAARQQGSQHALIAVRLAAARAAGCTLAAVEADASTGSSLNNIVRGGFRAVGTRLNYLCES